MSQKERVKIKIKNFLKHFETSSTTKDEANVDDDSASLNNAGANEDKLKKKEEIDQPIQYHLEATSLRKRGGRFCFCTARVGSTGLSTGINPNERLARSLHWMFLQ